MKKGLKVQTYTYLVLSLKHKTQCVQFGANYWKPISTQHNLQLLEFDSDVGYGYHLGTSKMLQTVDTGGKDYWYISFPLFPQLDQLLAIDRGGIEQRI